MTPACSLPPSVTTGPSWKPPNCPRPVGICSTGRSAPRSTASAWPRATTHHDAEAKVHFTAAVAAFTEAAEENAAAVSLSQREAADERLVPDADVRLELLLAVRHTIASPSLERSGVLVGLAELAQGNSDDFEATGRLSDAIAESARACVPHPWTGWP